MQTFAPASKSSSAKNEYGCDTQILDAGDAIRLEPALDRLSESFVGAVYSQDDAVADARLSLHVLASG